MTTYENVSWPQRPLTSQAVTVWNLYKGLSQCALAELSGVPRRTIQYWERYGFETATIKNALKVARVLGKTIEELLD